MTIGIDLSPIQGPHRMRGIGYTLINLINYLPAAYRKKHDFVFFMIDQGSDKQNDVFEIINIEDMNYEIRTIQSGERSTKRLPGRLNLLVSAFNASREIWALKFGDPRIKQLKGVDVFLQTDQSQSLPRKRGLKKLLVVYDIIPYTLEWDYLWKYSTARHVYGYSRKAAVRCAARRYLYSLKLRLNIRRADRLLAISEVTRQDFLRSFHIKSNRIITTPLGTITPNVHSGAVALMAYEKTSWGYREHPYKINLSTPFLLFVGGADKRRKLQDLVTAFNNLRAQGVDIKLVLAGDSMQGPDTIATEEIQGALKNSSYLKDVIFLGFVNDVTRDWLYKHALSFVFPSRYEGFGLPVLEAFTYGCPVICYDNGAVREVAREAPLYAENSTGIEKKVKFLIDANEKELQSLVDRGRKQASKYDWSKTSVKIFDLLGEE